MGINSLKTVVGYYIHPMLSLGLGIGLTSYTYPALNTLPVFIDIRYHPIEMNKRLTLNGTVGVSLITSESQLKGESNCELLVGYQLLKIGRADVVSSVGYDLLNYSVRNDFKQIRHSLILKVGVFF